MQPFLFEPEELGTGECQIAVAGDYAICRFFGNVKDWASRKDWNDRENHPYVVLPFAKLRNQVKLLARPKGGSTEAPALAELQGKCIAFWPHSIHEEFLQKSGLNCVCSNSSPTSENAALINFIAEVATGEADACVLVEPYFLALEKAGFKTIATGAEMDWYMCAVMKTHGFENYAETERRLVRVITEACRAVDRDRGEAMRMCARYVLSEFTGIDGNTLAANMTAKSIDFQKPSLDDFMDRIETLCTDDTAVGRGANAIRFNSNCVILE